MALREAIGRVLRANDVENVFDEVCRVIVESGFVAAGAGTDDDVRVRAGNGEIPRDLVERAKSTGRPAIRSTTAVVPFRDKHASSVLAVLAKDEAAFDSETIDVLGDLAAVVASAVSNHTMRAAEAELVEREAAYRSLAENTPDLITRWDRSMRRLFVNRAFAEMLQRTSEQLVGSHLGEDYTGEVKRIVGANVKLMKQTIERVFESGETAFLEIPVPNDRGVGVAHLTLVPERDVSGTVRSVLGIGRDITAIRESERDARTLSDSSPDFISRFDAQGHFRFVNKAVLDLIGQSVNQLIGRHFRDVFTGDPYLERLATILDDAIHGGTPVETELELPINGRLRAFNIRVHPERDYEGKFASALVVSRDITEHRALEQQLRQAQKMEAVGQLAGGIAHDFNNMLAAILMQAGLASRPHSTPTAIREALRAITDTTERAARLTQQLLTFSRREPANPVHTDLSELVASAANLLRRVLGEHIAIHVRVRGDRPYGRVDPVMVEQVLMNLGINARDAMPGGGSLVIALETVDIHDVELLQHPGGRPGKYVCIMVTDTGVGIDPTDLPRIFEPFFTTKEIGRGTGLGLATVFGIVQQHDGWIEVDSMLGQGTTFRIYFPAQDAAPAALESTHTAVPARGGNETVLLVEDEDAVRSAVRQVLEEYGYRVVEAESAAVALRRFGAGELHIDLLLTDVIMPGGVSGMQLADRMLEKQPGLRVILMSGYGADPANGDRTILRKPFAPEELVAAVRASIEGR